MTQEDKEILLKDLCARLPYEVKLECKWKTPAPNGTYGMITKMDSFVLDQICNIDDIDVPFDEVKPFLFPLSSLTEEQRNDISKLIIDTKTKFSPYGKINPKGCDNLFISTVKQANVLINYCLTHHLDINGLIEKGLAIDANGLNIY